MKLVCSLTSRLSSRNVIEAARELACIESQIETVNGPTDVRFPNFSAEMETGTGKTYVYIRTVLELFQRYDFSKFIIVVPWIAIREGVLNHLSMTSAPFRELFGNIPYRSYVYDSANFVQVRQFASPTASN
jgi:type III restriction enzyme